MSSKSDRSVRRGLMSTSVVLGESCPLGFREGGEPRKPTGEVTPQGSSWARVP